jgi:hypothetical protein
MGRKPGERMMGQLKERAEAISGEINSQAVANTLWELAGSCKHAVGVCDNPRTRWRP